MLTARPNNIDTPITLSVLLIYPTLHDIIKRVKSYKLKHTVHEKKSPQSTKKKKKEKGHKNKVQKQGLTFCSYQHQPSCR